MKVKYIGEGKGVFLYNINFKPGVEMEVADDLEFNSVDFEVSKEKAEKPESKSKDSSEKPKKSKSKKSK